MLGSVVTPNSWSKSELDEVREQKRRGTAAQRRIQQGQVSRARHELTGASLAPKTRATLDELQQRRPQEQRRENSPASYSIQSGCSIVVEQRIVRISIADFSIQERGRPRRTRERKVPCLFGRRACVAAPSFGSRGFRPGRDTSFETFPARDDDCSEEERWRGPWDSHRVFVQTVGGQDTRTAVWSHRGAGVCSVSICPLHEGWDGLRGPCDSCNDGFVPSSHSSVRRWNWGLRSCFAQFDAGEIY